MTERGMSIVARLVRAVVAGIALMVLVVPMNSRLDTVKPCGEEVACSVPRYKSLALSLAATEAPFNGLNRISVPVLVVAAIGLGFGAGKATELMVQTGRKLLRS